MRSGCADTQLPSFFETAEHAREWLPEGWHPDEFSVDQISIDRATRALTAAPVVPVELAPELEELVARLDRHGLEDLRQVLALTTKHRLDDLTDEDAARLTRTYATFLDVVGAGTPLTAAGYLPPKLVEQLAERTGITRWWIGKANREDLTPPIADIRDSARALGLVSVRKGRLSPTAAGLRVRDDPRTLLNHIVGRLPAGTKAFDREAGWMALVVAGSGVPLDTWRTRISDLLLALGWRVGHDEWARPISVSPTLTVLEQLGGAASDYRLTRPADQAVEAVANAVLHRA